MESLQVELFGGLSRHKLHRGALDRLSDCLRVAEVVLLSLGIWPYVLRRHQPGIVAESFEFPLDDAHQRKLPCRLGTAANWLTAPRIGFYGGVNYGFGYG